MKIKKLSGKTISSGLKQHLVWKFCFTTMKSHFFLLVIFVFPLLMSCDPEPETITVQGMSPIYASTTDFSYIRTEAAREIGELGKIVNVGNTIYINEILEGIHVIDNTDPVNPDFIYFLNIPGNTEFTIEGNTLYADNSRDLLVIDITDITSIEVVEVVENVYGADFNPIFYRPPFDYSGPFACVRADEGIVVDWEFRLLTDPNCTAN